jgi:carboxyl-terminal processing protease
LRPGHIITNVDGVPVDRAVRERLGKTAATGTAARDWALRQVLAGPRNGVLRLTVRDSRGPSYLEIERKKVPPMATPPLIARRMGDERDIGYIRIKDSLGDAHLVEAFDGALTYVRGTRALILDLRETSALGDRAVTEAILGRFANGNAGHASRILVLVDRWTAGEGEALAAKLAESTRATLVGTPTAGIHGELGEVKLPHSGIVVRFPEKKTARDVLTPAVEVNLAAPSGGPGDPILYQALKLAERR